MEADPPGFFRRELPARLREAAGHVARFFGGRAEDWAFVENATAGTNAILRSLDLAPGEEILCLSQVYGAVANALRHHAGRRGVRIRSLPVPVPYRDPEPLLSALAAALGPKTRLAALDHITSAGGVVLPIAEMAAICRGKGVPVAVDGAHAPGQIALDVPALGVQWYVGNLHKWAFAAKGTGVLWCAAERQAELHPVTISHDLGQGFAAEFDYCGTRDNSPWLAVPAALDFLEAAGPGALRERNRALAASAGQMLSEAWRSDCAAAPEFCAAMAAVRVPGSWAESAAARLEVYRILDEHRIRAGVMLLDDGLWIRVSAQIYNELDDYRRLVELGPLFAGRAA
ncbi:MAG TPA: aminotransferase class V-fold PLP-dependent enzyme [Stellaceae bacterium]|nr:aminotransferase class V-fold PLP-dependent enzyme [Stellaceae bacterium]